MTSTAITTLEHQLEPLAPKLAEALAGQIPVERLIRTIVISCEKNPALLNCERQSILVSAMSAAVLGLEVDGVTGQAYLIPFKKHAQLVIGYKGYNTLAARGGITITGACVKEGDEFDFELGSSAFVRHKPELGNQGRIIAAWATATHRVRPPVVSILSIKELLETKDRSPGAHHQDSPWSDSKIGFPAMCEKTAKRRLARSMPLTVMQMAARMDEAVEEGAPAWITPERGLEINGATAPAIGNYEDSPTPKAAQLTGPSLVETAKAKAKEGRQEFEAWYANLSDTDQQTVDRHRKRKPKGDVI